MCRQDDLNVFPRFGLWHVAFDVTERGGYGRESLIFSFPRTGTKLLIPVGGNGWFKLNDDFSWSSTVFGRTLPALPTDVTDAGEPRPYPLPPISRSTSYQIALWGPRLSVLTRGGSVSDSHRELLLLEPFSDRLVFRSLAGVISERVTTVNSIERHGLLGLSLHWLPPLRSAETQRTVCSVRAG